MFFLIWTFIYEFIYIHIYIHTYSELSGCGSHWVSYPDIDFPPGISHFGNSPPAMFYRPYIDKHGPYPILDTPHHISSDFFVFELLVPKRLQKMRNFFVQNGPNSQGKSGLIWQLFFTSVVFFVRLLLFEI